MTKVRSTCDFFLLSEVVFCKFTHSFLNTQEITARSRERTRVRNEGMRKRRAWISC